MDFKQSIGIKQVIRYEWMQYTVKLLLSSMKTEDIKKELELYLSNKKGCGDCGERAKYTMSIAISILLNTWVTPKPSLIQFRDKLLKIIEDELHEKACHWAMISSAYPFWFNMSFVFGSLFRLQDKVKKSHVMNRTYETFGERNTIERCSRYVIRSFVAWDIIRDMKKAGNYEKGENIFINDNTVVSLLIEAALHAMTKNAVQLTSIVSNPSFFIFSMPKINGQQICNNNIIIENMSVDNEYLRLKI